MRDPFARLRNGRELIVVETLRIFWGGGKGRYKTTQ